MVPLKMKWIEAKIEFESWDTLLASDLIADVLYDFGLQGVIIENPDIESVDGWVDAPLTMSLQRAVIGFFPEDDQAENRCRELEDALEELHKKTGITSRVEYRTIDEKDWAESWKEHFLPQNIGGRIVVKPTWHEYRPSSNEIVIEIDPGMAFGTGLHPTSRQCIHMMEKYLKEGDAVLDIGTGSGILMVAAHKFGAEMALGIDMDEIAIDVARKNLQLNGITSEKFKVRTGNLVDGINDRFDLVVANLSPKIILNLLGNLRQVMMNHGIFICSGLLEEHVDEIVKEMEAIELTILEIHSEKEWAVIVGQR